MGHGVRAATFAAAVVVALAGCRPDAGSGPAQAPGGQGGPGVAAAAGPTSVVTEVRRTRLEVPKGMQLQTMEFADATHGYATFVSRYPVEGSGDSGRYASSLYATADGGRTWKQLADPRRPSLSPQLYTVDSRTLVLLAEPYGWFVSSDGGATFQARPAEPAPPEIDAIYSPYSLGAFRVYCEKRCVLRRYDGARSTMLPQPNLPGELGAVVSAGDMLWITSLDSKLTPYTAFSRDGGMTWQRRDVPEHPGGRPTRVDFRVSADGRDVWLVGYLAGPIPGYHSAAFVPSVTSLGAVALRRKDVGVPLLWLLSGDRWVSSGTAGAPTPSDMPYAVAAIGGGLAAVTGPHGLALVDATWHPIDMTPRPEWVTTLRDGTVAASASRPTSGTMFLGRREGRGLSWVQVELGPA